jgi:hypothetical protein
MKQISIIFILTLLLPILNVYGDEKPEAQDDNIYITTEDILEDGVVIRFYTTKDKKLVTQWKPEISTELFRQSELLRIDNKLLFVTHWSRRNSEGLLIFEPKMSSAKYKIKPLKEIWSVGDINYSVKKDEKTGQNLRLDITYQKETSEDDPTPQTIVEAWRP